MQTRVGMANLLRNLSLDTAGRKWGSLPPTLNGRVPPGVHPRKKKGHRPS